MKTCSKTVSLKFQIAVAGLVVGGVSSYVGADVPPLPDEYDDYDYPLEPSFSTTTIYDYQTKVVTARPEVVTVTETETLPPEVSTTTTKLPAVTRTHVTTVPPKTITRTTTQPPSVSVVTSVVTETVPLAPVTMTKMVATPEKTVTSVVTKPSYVTKKEVTQSEVTLTQTVTRPAEIITRTREVTVTPAPPSRSVTLVTDDPLVTSSPDVVTSRPGGVPPPVSEPDDSAELMRTVLALSILAIVLLLVGVCGYSSYRCYKRFQAWLLVN